MKELFGQRLREQRIKHGLTLEQLAEKSELSSNYIGMVERGLKEARSCHYCQTSECSEYFRRHIVV